MPTIPNETNNITGMDSAPILNALKNEASSYYRSMVPDAISGDMQNLREIGAIILGNPLIYNEFLPTLVNRIAMVIINSRLYRNPWEKFKKGLLEYGETVEDIFVNLAKPFQFNPEEAESTLYKREMPDVRTAFYHLNYQKFYKVTVSEEQLRQAFLSWTGISELITKIVETLYTAANYDEFLVMKYLIARNIVNGNFVPVEIPTPSETNAKEIVEKIKSISNLLEYMSSDYNPAHVHTYSDKSHQILINTANFDASVDVNVLAVAFNMEKTEFMGHRASVDSFSTTDEERLALLFKDDSNYTPLTEAEKTALKTVPSILVDSSFFMIFDNLYRMTEKYNSQGLYFNYFYHCWKTFASSPFANAIVFTTQTPTVTSVTITPSALTVTKGQSAQLLGVASVTGFANNGVTYSLSGTDETTSTITNGGLLRVAMNEPNTTLTVTATSISDSSKTATATVTIV